MSQNNSDEINLSIVFDKIKELNTKLSIGIYKSIQFVLKHWWKLLLLIVIGYGIGYYLEQNNEVNKESIVIVQNNFKSSNYVYDAVEQLNRKIKDKDSAFLKNAGLYRNDKQYITSVEITPIVSMQELARNNDYNGKSMGSFLEKANAEDDLLASEVFRDDYKYHKLYITTLEEGSREDIKNVLIYVNSNEIFSEIREIIVSETRVRINYYKETIEQINSILEANGVVDVNKESSDQVIVSKGNDYTDFYQIISAKNNAVTQVAKLESDMVKFDNIVTVINKPALLEMKGFLDNKKLLYAFLFVFAFVFFHIASNRYIAIKELAENTDKNN